MAPKPPYSKFSFTSCILPACMTLKWHIIYSSATDSHSSSSLPSYPPAIIPVYTSKEKHSLTRKFVGYRIGGNGGVKGKGSRFGKRKMKQNPIFSTSFG